MFNIAKYFQKFTKIAESNLDSNNKIINAIKNISGLTIEGKNFGLQDGVLRFNLNPVQKNEIFMRKSKILSELNSLGSGVRDIR